MDVREKAKNDKRLIDANVLAKAIRTDYFEHFTQYHDTDQIALIDMVCDDIEESPTVDAVEVVRCRECKHWKPSGSKAGNSFLDMEYIGGCEITNYYRSESDFCSYGERKEGDD